VQAEAPQFATATSCCHGTPVSVDVILERLNTLHVKLIDLSLDRLRRLLAILGNPQDRLPPVVHVAGTNGKGSTLAFMRAALEAAGYRVHVYTSPHLVRFNERIRLDGRLIDEAALLALLDEVERANKGEPITFFEITTALAFLAFARAPADIVLLETGLGGRGDATNVIARPAVTAITPVSLDHQHFLGDTIAAIAGEKAGILKARVPAVLAPQLPDAQAVLEARARAVGAPLFRAGQEWRAEPTATGSLLYLGRRWRLDLPPPRLLGRHQYDNAGTAIACLDRLDGFALDAETLSAGLLGAEWPARLQRLERGPLAEALPPGVELWLDGGHNQAGGEALAKVAEDWRDRPLALVFGMLQSHDAAAFLLPLAPFVESIEAVTIPGQANSLAADASVAAAEALGLPATAHPDVGSAVAAAADAVPGGRVLICGSLYLAGSVLAENG
jgi:dihydrofolate synthase/folylpolyglutamate synthase